LWVYYHVRTELRTAHALAKELLKQAQTWHDPILLNQAHHALGITSTDLGCFAEALEHLEQALALYAPEQHRAHLGLSVYDTGVICQAFAAHNLWYLGYPDQAAQRTLAALNLAQELAHPYTTAGTLCLAAVSAALRCDWRRAQEWAEAVVALSHEHGFPYFSAWGTILRGAALSAQGQCDVGIVVLRQGLDTYRATGAAVLYTYWAVLLAEALGRVGAAEEGLRVLDAALATIPDSGEQRSEAELYRFKGELLQHLPGHLQQADLTPEACFHQALDVARRQQAKSLELRATVSLGWLWMAQGKRSQACQLLEGIYSWFSEGFDTPDLQAAKALLDSCT
jgi:predicted ATPase